MYDQKYHFNVSQFQNPIFKIEEKTKTSRIDEMKKYLLQNPERYLTGQDIVNMFHVIKITANRYIKDVLKQDSNNYKMIHVTVLREHKNGNKQKNGLMLLFILFLMNNFCFFLNSSNILVVNIIHKIEDL